MNEKVLKYYFTLCFLTAFSLHANSSSYLEKTPIKSIQVSSDIFHPLLKITGLAGGTWNNKRNTFGIMPFYCFQIIQRAQQDFFSGQSLGLRFINKRNNFILGSHLLFVKDLNLVALGIEYFTPLSQTILHFHTDTIFLNDQRKKDTVAGTVVLSDNLDPSGQYKLERLGEVEYNNKSGVRLRTIFSMYPALDVHTILYHQYSHFNFKMDSYRIYQGINIRDHKYEPLTENYSGYLYQSGMVFGLSYKLFEKAQFTTKLYGGLTYDTLQGWHMQFELSLQHTIPVRNKLIQKMYQPIQYTTPIYPTSVEMGILEVDAMQAAVQQVEDKAIQNASFPARNMIRNNVNTLEKMYDKHSFSPEIAEQSAYLFWMMSPENKKALCDTASKAQQFTETSKKPLPIEIRTKIYKGCLPDEGYKFIRQGLDVQPFNLTKTNRNQHYEYIDNLLTYILRVRDKKHQNTQEKQLCALLNTSFTCEDIIENIVQEIPNIRTQKIYHLFRLET